MMNTETDDHTWMVTFVNKSNGKRVNVATLAKSVQGAIDQAAWSKELEGGPWLPESVICNDRL